MERESLRYLSLDPTGPESSPPGVSGYVSPSPPELGFLILTIGRVLTPTNSFRIHLFRGISTKSSREFTSKSLRVVISKVTPKKHIQGFMVSASTLAAFTHVHP